jgi:signal transduction histidine kinase
MRGRLTTTLAITATWLAASALWAREPGHASLAGAPLVTLAFGAVIAAAGAWSDSWRRQRAPREWLDRALEVVTPRLNALLAETRERERLAQGRRNRREELVAAIRHELLTPLNAILGFTQLLESEVDGALSDAQREDVLAMTQAGEHLHELVQEVLEVAERGNERGTVLVQVDLTALVRDVSRWVEGQVAPGVRVSMDASEVWLARVDPRRLRQILLNLGGNAAKFTARGSIVFSLRSSPEHLEIEVSDTGVGIEEAELSRIFVPHEQAVTAGAGPAGWGLGLSIARGLARAQGGDIEASSRKGVGSRFVLRLPASVLQ